MTGRLGRLEELRGGDGDWHLRDERDLLVRSLEDAAREHSAGDLTNEDYELLRVRDERRLAVLDAALAAALEPPRPEPERAAVSHEGEGVLRELDDQVPARRRRWRRRWWFAALGVAAVVAAALILVVQLTSSRLPGEYATGSISLNTAQAIERQLGQAKALVAGGNDTQALTLYGDVLAEDPRQPVALAEWGWLDWRAATSAKEQTVAAEGASALEEAVRIEPELFAAEYYLGVVLYDEGAAPKAVGHFRRFLADKPTATWLHDAAPDIRAAYGAAHDPLPAGVPAG